MAFGWEGGEMVKLEDLEGKVGWVGLEENKPAGLYVDKPMSIAIPTLE